MDLGTVKKRLESSHYRDLHNFVLDVHLCFDNAMLYNPKNSDVHNLAKSLKKDFDSHYRQAIAHSEMAIEQNRTNENACLICGEIGLKFEPPVYYCNGRCGGQRIRRNAFYFTNSNNTYHWCSACFTDLRQDQPIKLPDCTLFKADLAKNRRKHSEDSEESWVQCDGELKEQCIFTHLTYFSAFSLSLSSPSFSFISHFRYRVNCKEIDYIDCLSTICCIHILSITKNDWISFYCW